MRDAQHPATAEISLTRVLAALSDPIRLGLVRLLADGEERAWNELRVPVAKSTLSHHLKVLRAAGVTRTRQDGTRCFVRLRGEDLRARFPGLLDALLDTVRTEEIGAEVGGPDTTPAR
ncbi:ArsR/SmtB family transcription factor [Amycolatopsis aidingensis]|uniref:ArsR/SmtB family transcription factor n=1 Tax=Amycolatopsis aidingensis TaxID=2842453 RepID=UPI001C0B2DD9|nr:metalloregulator ArsR/SmtB family transcription factor [Amycolatopsis aidingensis]